MHHNKNIDDYTDIYCVNSLYFIIHKASGCFIEKMEINT